MHTIDQNRRAIGSFGQVLNLLQVGLESQQAQSSCTIGDGWRLTADWTNDRLETSSLLFGHFGELALSSAPAEITESLTTLHETLLARQPASLSLALASTQPPCNPGVVPVTVPGPEDHLLS